MPIPVMNFQPENIDQVSPFLRGANMGQQMFSQGLKNAYAPQTMAEQLKQLQLANALAQIQNQYAEPMTQAELALKQQQLPFMQAQTESLGIQNKYAPQDYETQFAQRRAQTGLLGQETKLKQFQVQNPLLSLSGPAGQVGALMYLQQHPELGGAMQQNAQPQSPYDTGNMSIAPQLGQAFSQMNQQKQPQSNMVEMLRDSITNQLRQKAALTNLLERKTSGYDWATMPVQYKQQALAQAKALGYQPSEATQLFNQGANINDLAQAKGVDPNNLPLPEYLPTPTTLTRFQQSKVALAGLNALDPIITEAVAPYARRFKGYSLEQISDAIKGEKPDQQAKYLAAAALQPEIAALRIKSAQGTVGITAINEMIASAQNRIQTLQPTLSPEVYTKMNNYITQWLNKSNDAEQRAMDVYETKYRNQPTETGQNFDIGSMSDDELMRIAGMEG